MRDGTQWSLVKNLAAALERVGPIEPLPLNIARQDWAMVREVYGRKPNQYTAPLLTAPDGNAKIARSNKPTYSLALSAGRRGYNVCPCATDHCEDPCLGKCAGRNIFAETQTAQDMRTYFLAAYPRSFVTVLDDELWRGLLKRQRDVGPNATIACRLNAYSDVIWPRVLGTDWFAKYRNLITFYDYTKRHPRTLVNVPNYHLTISANERTTHADIRAAFASGRNVAIVGARRYGEPLPASIYPIIDGDRTDARWTDPRGVIVHLSRKGKKLHAESPFIRDDLLGLTSASVVIDLSPRRAT